MRVGLQLKLILARDKCMSKILLVYANEQVQVRLDKTDTDALSVCYLIGIQFSEDMPP